MSALTGFLSTEWNYVKRKVVALRTKRRLSFITIHYLYLLGWTIVGSILIFPAGGIQYIDALFFASGSSTQSGLNTVDFNLLNTYQQVVIYFICMLTNPITINTFVVFVRLYWFEKRFEHIVEEVRAGRGTRTRSRTNSIAQANADSDVERGVNGRKITVLHDQGRTIGPVAGFKEKSPLDNAEPASSSASSEAARPEDSEEQTEDEQYTPRNLSTISEAQTDKNARHIAFLEEQRNPKNKSVLRIPGPREAEQGAVPEEVEAKEGDDDVAKDEERDHLTGILKPRTESQSHPMRPNVTIEEPPRPMHGTNSVGHRRLPSNPYAPRTPIAPVSAADALEDETVKTRRTNSIGSAAQSNTAGRLGGTVSYLSWQPTVGRNSTFFDLTEEQREELGGIEYRSLKTLALILVSYFVGFHLLGVIILVPWILLTDTWGQVVDADGQNRTWWGIFSAATFFNDLGFTLTPDSFISFQQAVLVLLLGSFLIVIGNTGFPCMLRFVIWVFSKVLPKDSGLYEEIKFLLDHPRRCFTLLFPSGPTWILLGILVLLNGIDLIFFVILDLNDPVVTSLPPAFRFLDGLFQAFSTRTAGTACVNLAALHPGIQVSYLIMMYISVFPIAISVRRTNVYEERSLGIYSNTADEEEDEKEPSFIGAHLRRQLSFDLWFIFLGLFIVAIAEGNRIADPNDPDFTLFACLFEIVSAYGTVGLSLGYPNINASFSAEFTVVSKLVIIAMQIRGRHRGLPYELDRAILLPSEALHRKEEEDANRRGIRRASTLNLDDEDGESDETGAEQLARITSRNTAHSRATHVSGRDSVFHQHNRPARRGVGEFIAALAVPTPQTKN